MANLNAACRGVGNEGFCPWNFARGKVKDMTNNKHVLTWLDEMVALVKPDKVVWIDGSEEQLKALRDEALSTGEMEALNQEELPGCLLHRTKKNDVARVEGRTYICTKNRDDAAPINNWMETSEMKAKLTPCTTA